MIAGCAASAFTGNIFADFPESERGRLCAEAKLAGLRARNQVLQDEARRAQLTQDQRPWWEIF